MFDKLKTAGLAFTAMLIFVVSGGYFAWLEGHKHGYEKAQGECLRLQKQQAEASQRALQEEFNRSQQQLVSIRQHEQTYLARTEELTARNAELQRKINDVTQHYIDERGKVRPVDCVFTRGFVQQYNAALGVSAPDAATAARDAGAAAAAVQGADARLRASGISQRDILANLADNGQRCQQLALQVRGLQNYIAEVSR
ncbi:hypothetical protein JRC42_19560 [Escherichia albertii]|uniref:hypothetical protein n=1 Tax=Escherichia albertii TaxID=208962 RepID=UPI00195A3A4C|nr:hypothetical protein [Escherichia albertii]QST27737.1 hypothetical protein JRC42_19560 [Escherichia albertii]QST37104.1 hypothetical protein JRC46_19560 [Escherichia albertii]